MPRTSAEYNAFTEDLTQAIRRRRAAFSAEIARHGLLLVSAADAPEYQDDTEPLCYPAAAAVPAITAALTAESSPGSGAVR